MLSSAINLIDDPIRLVMRWMGKNPGPKVKATRLHSAWSGMKGNLAFIPIAATAGVAFAPRGHKMSAAAAGAAGMIAFALGDFAGTLFGGPLAGFVTGSIAERVGNYVGEGVQMLHDFNNNVKHINMGGNYEDTQVAYTMRQRAAQELGSSVLNARQYLGKEALYMHQ